MQHVVNGNPDFKKEFKVKLIIPKIIPFYLFIHIYCITFKVSTEELGELS